MDLKANTCSSADSKDLRARYKLNLAKSSAGT